MPLSKKRIIGIILTILIGTLILWLMFWFTRNLHRQPGSETPRASVPESFSFLELTAASRFSTDLRERLKNRLGADSYETKTTIDLELHGKGFLATTVPALDALNQELNYLHSERVEHDTIQLTYRYARKKNTPFTYVRLLFAGDAESPLFFLIRTDTEGAGLLEAIRNKYGAPVTKSWENGKGKSHLWEKNKDILIISETTSRIGTPRYHFGFYFVNNIMTLLETEKTKRLEHRKALEKTGRTAF